MNHIDTTISCLEQFSRLTGTANRQEQAFALMQALGHWCHAHRIDFADLCGAVIARVHAEVAFPGDDIAPWMEPDVHISVSCRLRP